MSMEALIDDYEDDFEDAYGFDDDLESEEFGIDDEDVEEALDLEQLGEAALEDAEAEDEFLGALAGIAAKALPALASTVVPHVLRFGKRLLKGGRRRRKRVIRRLPRIVKRAIPVLRRRARTIRRKPVVVQVILTRAARGRIPRRR